jgi:tRNA A-37 threonylcarbamoyl transferase component Bud32
MAASLTSGTFLAGFRIQSLVGEGAMGAVYLAEEVATGRRVALKLLARELAHDERFRRRFLRESRLAASLEHPNVVRVLGSGEEDGLLYLAMAYVEGSDLAALVRREGRLEPERALALLAQIAQALDAAHAAGLVHRDVKPANILISSGTDGEGAYVCDFGVARHVSSIGSLTGDRGFVGTVDYVPPEQIEGGVIDGRADVYSLGCVLYECLSGERPFGRDSELSVVFAHLNEPPPRLSDVRPEFPQAIDDVFASALAKSPDDRYSTCSELVEAGRSALRGQRHVRRKLRRRRLLATTAGLAAAGAAIAGVAMFGGAHAPPSISQSSIAGAKLGLEPIAYEKLFGRESGRERLPVSGHTKLTFAKRKVAVYFYFKGLTDSAVEITTWNKAFRTAEGIGPCSTIAHAKKVYGRRFRPNAWNAVGGQVYAYSVGRHLSFAAQGLSGDASKRVSAVGLYYGGTPGASKRNGAGRFASWIAINEHHC